MLSVRRPFDHPCVADLDRWRPAAFGGCCLALLAAVAVIVGRYAAPHRHDFVDANLAATVGTALGTTLLAIFTAGLAWSSLREQRERDRPVVVLINQPMWQRIRLDKDEPGGGRLAISLMNVGLGPALGVTVWAECSLTPHATIRPAALGALAPGDVVHHLTIDIAFDSEPPPGFGAARLNIGGTYGDRVGRGPYPVITQWTPPPRSVQPEHEGPPEQ